MSKHTPGPWITDTCVGDRWRVSHQGRWTATAYTKPDARLIAAAPDLLAALKLVEPYVSLDHLGQVHAAIAKAEGTS